MSSKAKEIMEDNMSDAIYDNITGGYSGSIEGYNKATEQCVMVANEYAKDISIGFGKYLLSTKADLDLTTEQLFDKFIQSLNQ